MALNRDMAAVLVFTAVCFACYLLGVASGYALEGHDHGVCEEQKAYAASKRLLAWEGVQGLRCVLVERIP